MKLQNEIIPNEVYAPHFGVNKEMIGVEIGVSGGVGSVSFLSKFPKLRLYCIDPWKHFPGAPFEANLSQEIHDEAYLTTMERIAPYSDRVIVLRKTSNDALADIPDGLDFVHIDGHHVYEQVLADIKNYYPKIKSGGVMSGHDFFLVRDVSRAVYETFAETHVIHVGCDYTWWIYKKGAL